MQSENLKEYSLIREEMKTVKDCMTNYVGYVLGGSGAAIFGLIALSDSNKDPAGMAYAALLMSLLISMVLLIIHYKFYSHNRYAGYCKLLSHESFSSPPGTGKPDLFAWETCVERLRVSEAKPHLLLEWTSAVKGTEPGADGLRWVIMKCVGDPKGDPDLRTAPLDKWRFWKGIQRLILALLGKSRTNSWGFPPFVTAVFFVLCTGFLAFGEYSAVMSLDRVKAWSIPNIALVFVAITVAVAQCFLWFLFCRRLQSLMDGSATVEGFFWRFLPIRFLCLRDYGIKPSYANTDHRIRELQGSPPLTTTRRSWM